jgi:hypothetical protein
MTAALVDNLGVKAPGGADLPDGDRDGGGR